MTQRKPGDVSWRSWIDQQVHAAEAEGEFDDLPGKGQPLQNLHDAGDPNWWAKSYLRREGLAFLPPTLELRREVEATRARLSAMRDEKKVRGALESLNRRIGALNRTATSGPPTNIGLLDVEAAVEAWAAEKRSEGEPPVAPEEAQAARPGWLARLAEKLAR